AARVASSCCTSLPIAAAISAFLFLSSFRDPRELHSFPTRRSSDLSRHVGYLADPLPRQEPGQDVLCEEQGAGALVEIQSVSFQPDRKSTRLNSSHVKISYAVFCLKKKRHNISHH